MRFREAAGYAAVLFAAVLPLRARIADAPLPESKLALRVNGEWRVWWRSSEAPVRWNGTGVLTSAVPWRKAADGVVWGEVNLAGTGEAWRVKIVVARIQPGRVQFSLDTAFGNGAAWRINRAPSDAILAVNTGQFLESIPWGWVRLSGHDFFPAAHGPLASSVAIMDNGNVQWGAADDSIPVPQNQIAWGFQSYPTLLRGGEVPIPLRAPDRGIDVAHRDARLALGRAADGTIIIAMTRFEVLGATLGIIPFGLTTPEMAAVMGALGATDAVLLDGGISAQMLIRGRDGVHRWPGVRAVPLALIVHPRR